MKRPTDERGLSLIETLAALTIFAVMTVGITPLLSSSLRGSTLSRSLTVGKDVALQAMERVRGLPYYVAYQSQSKKVDVLDMYFPCADPTLAATGCAGEGTRSYNATLGVFTLTCDDDDSGPSCAVPLPAGYSLRYEARFVRGDGSTTELPLTNYVRNPSATQGPLDSPATQLIELRVISFWNVQGTQRTQVLTTLIGAKKFGPIKMAGSARVGYTVQALTSYSHTTGDTRSSDLRAVAGVAESQFQTRLVSTARQSVRAADVTLIRRPNATDPLAVHLGISPLQGVIVEAEAPPNQAPNPAPSPTAGGVTMVHPNLLANAEIAFLNETKASGISASTTNELPSAEGSFSFSPSPNSTAGGFGYFWVNNQVDEAQNALLNLDIARQKVFSLKTQGTGNSTTTGSTRVSTTGLGSSREVRAISNTSIRLARAMPVKFLGGAVEERQAIVIKNFSANLDCRSTGGTTSTVTGSWTATFKMWRDAEQDGSGTAAVTAGVADTDVVSTDVTLSAAVAAQSTSLRTILAGAPYSIPDGNPLIFDASVDANDVYLFQDASRSGYITDFTIAPLTSAVERAGDLARASIDGAMNITTVPTNPLLPESALNISIGSLSCEALDQR